MTQTNCYATKKLCIFVHVDVILKRQSGCSHWNINKQEKNPPHIKGLWSNRSCQTLIWKLNIYADGEGTAKSWDCLQHISSQSDHWLERWGGQRQTNGWTAMVSLAEIVWLLDLSSFCNHIKYSTSCTKMRWNGRKRRIWLIVFLSL